MSEVSFSFYSTKLSGGKVSKLSLATLFSPSEIKKIHQIDIISAFYSLNLLEQCLKLCNQHASDGTKITFFFHKESGPMFREQDRSLFELKNKYSKKLKISIFLVKLGTLFHTKMYRFIDKNNEHKYFVGSSNFSNQGFSQNELAT